MNPRPRAEGFEILLHNNVGIGQKAIMSYCLSMLVKSGLVFAADSRTNAGVDSVSTFRKLHVYQRPGERVIVLLSAGNLAIGQSVATMLEEGIEENDPEDTLYNVGSLYDAAKMVGRALRKGEVVPQCWTVWQRS